MKLFVLRNFNDEYDNDDYIFNFERVYFELGSRGRSKIILQI